MASFGLRVGIRVTDPAMLPIVSEYLPPRARPSSSQHVDHLYSFVGDLDRTRRGSRKMHILYNGVRPVVRTTSLDTLLDVFRRDVEESVAIWSPEKLFVHAGSVVWKGSAILVPGKSYTGKTTIVMELVRQGAKYLSDEYAIIDAKGRVEAFPRQPRIRETAKDSSPAADLPADRPASGRYPVGLVVLTQYCEGAAWRPRIVTGGRGVLRLFENTVAARIRPSFALNRLTNAVVGASFLKGRRGEARDAASAILRRASELAEAKR